MSRDCLSERLRAAAATPQEQSSVRVNVSLSPDCDAEQRDEAVARLQTLSATPVNYRSGLGVATAVIPRNRIHELEAIDGVERADLDVVATYRELID